MQPTMPFEYLPPVVLTMSGAPPATETERRLNFRFNRRRHFSDRSSVTRSRIVFLRWRNCHARAESTKSRRHCFAFFLLAIEQIELRLRRDAQPARYLTRVLTNVKAGISVQLSQLARRGCRDAGTAIYHERRPLLVSRNSRLPVIADDDPQNAGRATDVSHFQPLRDGKRCAFFPPLNCLLLLLSPEMQRRRARVKLKIPVICLCQ